MLFCRKGFLLPPLLKFHCYVEMGFQLIGQTAGEVGNLVLSFGAQSLGIGLKRIGIRQSDDVDQIGA